MRGGRQQPVQHRSEAVSQLARDAADERVLAHERHVRAEHVVGARGDDAAVGHRLPALVQRSHGRSDHRQSRADAEREREHRSRQHTLPHTGRRIVAELSPSGDRLSPRQTPMAQALHRGACRATLPDRSGRADARRTRREARCGAPSQGTALNGVVPLAT